MAAALLLIAIAGCGDEPAPQGLSIFILAGQSNMSGRGDPDDLPADFNQPDKNIWLFGNDDVWKPALEPLDDASGQIDLVSADYHAGVGPGLAFAKQLRRLRPDMKIGLVPCALSGSAMDQWMAQGGAETLYGSCIRRAKEAMAQGRIAGFIWYQGESDTSTAKKVRAWPLNFKKMILGFRRDLDRHDMPVVFVQIGDLGPRFQNRLFRAYWRDMQKKQASMRIAFGEMVSAKGLPLMLDGVHLSTKAELILGRRIAGAMDNLLNDKKD